MDAKQAIILRTKLSNEIINRARKYGASGYTTDEVLDAVMTIIRLRTGVDTVMTKLDYEAAIGILNDILPEVMADG